MPDPVESEQQNELIRRYCADAEKLLDSVEDRAAALRMKERLCGQFQKECDSSLVVAAISSYLDGVVERRWQG